MAIAWGLEQTRYFTQGCQNLVVVTDHKPLTKIFGDRTLDEIYNTRLFRLKQRTLPWRFRVEYLPGKTNLAADAASRYPAPDTDLSTLTVSDQSEFFYCGRNKQRNRRDHCNLLVPLNRGNTKRPYPTGAPDSHC